MTTNLLESLEDRAKLEAMLLGGAAETKAQGATLDKVPLTPGQESLWFLEQLRPELPTYNVPQAFKLIGEFNLSAFQKSVEQVVKRHQALRTSFLVEGEKVSQKVAVEGKCRFEQKDLSQIAKPQQEPKL